MKNNCASRLSTTLQTMKSIGQSNRHAKDAWTEFLSLKPESIKDSELMKKIAHSATLIAEEVELVREAMVSINSVDQKNYAKELDNIISTVDNYYSWGQSWGDFLRFVTPSTFTVLGFCADLINQDEDILSDDEIQDIQSAVDAFEQSISEADLPFEAKLFFNRQIGVMRQALADYRIIGIRAFHRYVHETGLVLMDFGAVAQAHQKSEHFKSMKSIFLKIRQAFDRVVSAEKFALTGARWYGYARTVWDIYRTLE